MGVLPGALPTRGLALDAPEYIQLDATSSRAAELWLQAREKGGGLGMAPFGKGAKGVQTRPGDCSRAQGCVVAAVRALLDCPFQTLCPRRLTGGPVRDSSVKVDIRPESRSQCLFEVF